MFASKKGLVLSAVTLLASPAMGGGSHPHGDGGHAAESEERTAQVTVWGERFEAFLEHPPVIAGIPARFVTHLTDLETLLPRKEGAVTFVLAPQAGEPLTQAEPAPARAGIYLPELCFPAPGTWVVTIRIPIGDGETSVTLPPIRVHASKEEAAKAGFPEPPEGIPFLKEQQWKVGTGTESVTRHELAERLCVVGAAEAPAAARACVTPPTAGRLAPPRGGRLPFPGERVERGQVLALLQPPLEFAMRLAELRAGAVRARLACEQAELGLARTRRLAAEKAKSERELQEAEFAQRRAKADLEAAETLARTCAEAGLPLDGGGVIALELRSPLEGILTEVGASVGEFVQTDRRLFGILDPARVQVRARLPEANLPRLGKATGALIEIPGRPGESLEARIAWISPEAEAGSRTLSVLLELPPGDGRLRAGMSVRVHLETARVERCLAIPVQALVEEGGRPVAFVQLAGETFERRDLELGIRGGGLVEVRSGLKEGERVVTRSPYAIRLATVSGAIPAHGHVH